MITTLISAVAGLGSQWLKNRAEKAQAKHERQVMDIKGEQTWDQIQAEASKNSWKDEWFVVLFSLLLIPGPVAVMVDNQEMLARWKEMFVVLENSVPEMYWYILFVMISASFGIKKVTQAFNMFRGKK